MIHLTAIIGSGAKIGANVEIGPHSIVGGEVEIGDDTIIGANVVIESSVKIGRKNKIGHGAIIGSEPQDVNYAPTISSGVEIGNENVLREYVTVHRGATENSATKIGDGNFLMAGAHVGHNSRIGNKNIIANNCLLAGHVEIADQVFLGGGSVYHQHMRVGRMVMTQEIPGFGKDLPPFTMAARVNEIFGLNVVGLRRGGFSAAQRAEIKRAFQLLYRSGLTFRAALEKSRGEEWSELGKEFFEFVQGSLGGRGICGLAGSLSADD